MSFGQLSLGKADAPSYRDKEAARGQQDQSKKTWKDMVYMIFKLEFVQKQRSTSEHCDEEYKPSLEEP